MKLEFSWSRLFLPGARTIFWLAIFVGALAQGPQMMNMDGDLGRHITIGGVILDSGQVPTRDIFSYSMAGEELTPHEWLAQVAFALAYRVLGLDGVVIISAGIIATAFTLVLTRAYGSSASLLAALASAVLAAGASSLHWLTRPHIFTFLFLALWLLALDGIQQRKRLRWLLLPALMLVWVNTHGAFIAGFVMLMIQLTAWVWERWIEGRSKEGAILRDLALGGGASLLVTAINPAGLRIWETSLGYIQNRYLVGHTAEYLSPDFHSSSTWLFLILMVSLLVVMGVQRKAQPVQLVLSSAAWLAMALYSTRNIPLFAIVCAPLLASGLAELVREQSESRLFFARLSVSDQSAGEVEVKTGGLFWICVAIVGFAIFFSTGGRLDYRRMGNRFDPQVFPVATVDWMAQHPQSGNGFNYFPWGGYLLFRNWPEQRVFIDGQTDFYGEVLTRTYERVLLQDTGWQQVLDDYGVDWVIWPEDESLPVALERDGGWTEVYRDETSVIYRRISP